MQASDKTHRIAKNTIILYIRMIVMIFIGLFTSRVILNTLGVEDYGIYNVVGGIVAMFGIITSSLSSSISRFITIELGTNNIERLKKIFSTSVTVQLIISIIIVVLIEIVGLWFLYNKINIPVGRLNEAAFVMHCSIITFAISLNTMPYNASIIAHEKMGIFSYITLLDAILKLSVVYLLYISPFDKLETYALLLLIVSVIIQLLQFIYCRRQFQECRFSWLLDKQLLKEMSSFSGWSFAGNASYIINTQGINLLINIFFGVTINAARGIATQVDTMIQGFVNNFTTAMNPQIMKSYAAKDLQYMHQLVMSGSKFAYFLMLFFAIPICLETDIILTLWLKQVPEYSVPFVRLSLLTSMMTALGSTLTTSQSATGHIKYSSMVTSFLTFLDFPLSYFVFKIGYSPTSCYIIHFILYSLLQLLKIFLVKNYIKLSVKLYLKEVFLKVFLVSIVAFILPYLIYIILDSSFLRFLFVITMSAISTLVSIYLLGLTSVEKQLIINIIKKRFTQKK
jgi:hypothetical protein